jgi:hypothetical protein
MDSVHGKFYAIGVPDFSRALVVWSIDWEEGGGFFQFQGKKG